MGVKSRCKPISATVLAAVVGTVVVVVVVVVVVFVVFVVGPSLKSRRLPITKEKKTLTERDYGRIDHDIPSWGLIHLTIKHYHPTTPQTS